MSERSDSAYVLTSGVNLSDCIKLSILFAITVLLEIDPVVDTLPSVSITKFTCLFVKGYSYEPSFSSFPFSLFSDLSAISDKLATNSSYSLFAACSILSALFIATSKEPSNVLIVSSILVSSSVLSSVLALLLSLKSVRALDKSLFPAVGPNALNSPLAPTLNFTCLGKVLLYEIDSIFVTELFKFLLISPISFALPIVSTYPLTAANNLSSEIFAIFLFPPHNKSLTPLYQYLNIFSIFM